MRIAHRSCRREAPFATELSGSASPARASRAGGDCHAGEGEGGVEGKDADAAAPREASVARVSSAASGTAPAAAWTRVSGAAAPTPPHAQRCQPRRPWRWGLVNRWHDAADANGADTGRAQCAWGALRVRGYATQHWDCSARRQRWHPLDVGLPDWPLLPVAVELLTKGPPWPPLV